MGATLWKCRPGSPDRTVVPIGRPIANTQVYIVDAHMEPVPIGVPGELYIGGDGVARGYWRRDDLTAERFLADPFVSGGRLYRTGDLARYRGDGAIEFLGRHDDQVKIRGFRIEPGEVEAALGAHPELRAAAVVARAVEGHGNQLVAYVVPAGPRRPAGEELRRFLAQRLPEHMIPAAFVLLDHLPVTPNGKLDRARLPAPTSDRPQLDTAYAAPVTELEQRIVAVWRRLLDRTEVGVNDNFFDLGGHSLLMVRVQRALQEELASPIKLIDMFQFPTIRALAQHLAHAALPAAPDTPSAPAPPAPAPAFKAVRERVRKQQQVLKQRRIPKSTR
jgi:non-ribosomal peptide synthetase component F